MDKMAFWKGKRIAELDREELVDALAEVYHELEKTKWELFKIVGGSGQKTGSAGNLRLKKAA